MIGLVGELLGPNPVGLGGRAEIVGSTLSPAKFYMVINGKSAAALGLRIPDVIQVQADRIIE